MAAASRPRARWGRSVARRRLPRLLTARRRQAVGRACCNWCYITCETGITYSVAWRQAEQRGGGLRGRLYDFLRSTAGGYKFSNNLERTGGVHDSTFERHTGRVVIRDASEGQGR